MKKINTIFTSAIIGLAVFTSSCVNDLNVQPLDPTQITASKAYTDSLSYAEGLNKIYSVWALSGQDGAGASDISGLDPGNTVLLRSWWTLQEQTTDECKNAWPDSMNSFAILAMLQVM